MAETPELITTEAELAPLAEHLRAHGWFALDTEFIREKTFWPRLCLVQVATTERVACIDPFACESLDPLLAVLDDPDVTKVLHAAEQDLEIFHLLSGRVPQPLFDTQLAAPLLGHPDQAGYARLVEAVLSVQLAKGHARTDWAERPLPADALAYAADDVRYLVPLYQALREQLQARGRLEWLQADFRALADPARFERPPADAWQRLKGLDRLPAAGRAVAAALAEWRERTAREQDRPRGHVLRDDALLDIARALPKDRRALGRLRSLRDDVAGRHGDRLLELVAAARDRAAPPVAERGRGGNGLDTAGEALVDALSALVRLRAAREDLNPATIASRKELARIVAGEPAAEVLAGWRGRLAAADIDAFLAGRTSLRRAPDGGALIADS
ncbi:MAG: ribonuclease D [Halofilum sp. (in: g-proteobacteria)]|nr:ribonuclease D [Halofilum sp. (in: g-proteobacteria)]